MHRARTYAAVVAARRPVDRTGRMGPTDQRALGQDRVHGSRHRSDHLFGAVDRDGAGRDYSRAPTSRSLGLLETAWCCAHQNRCASWKTCDQS